MKTSIARRDFLTQSALVACGLIVPLCGAGILRAGAPAAARRTENAVLSATDQAVITELSASYGADVYLWGGPSYLPKFKRTATATSTTNLLVRVDDLKRLNRYLQSNRLQAQYGLVRADGPNLRFLIGSTAYTVTNYAARDFERMVSQIRAQSPPPTLQGASLYHPATGTWF